MKTRRRFTAEFKAKVALEAINPPVIDPRNATRKRKMRRYPRHLALAQQKQMIHNDLLQRRP